MLIIILCSQVMQGANEPWWDFYSDGFQSNLQVSVCGLCRTTPVRLLTSPATNYFKKPSSAVAEKSIIVKKRRSTGSQEWNQPHLSLHLLPCCSLVHKKQQEKTAAFPQTGWKKVSEFKRLKQKTQMATIIQYWKEKQTCLMKLALRDSHRPTAVVFVVIVIIL